MDRHLAKSPSGSTATARNPVQMCDVTVGLSVWVALTLLCAMVSETGADNPCQAPLWTREWNTTRRDMETAVMWSLQPNMTCNTSQGCFPNLPFELRDVELQLLPVEIQEGSLLSFQSAVFGGSWTLPILPVKVDDYGFRSCNVTGGVAMTDMATNETILVDPVALSAGLHYFIVDDPGETLLRCELGLRLNVTVKPADCRVTGDVMCSDRGLCLTQQGQPDYRCYCCGTYAGKYCERYNACLCRNGGTCVEDAKAQRGDACLCRHGFQGVSCEERVQNMCDVISCNNSGKCTGNRTHFHCACPAGFTGSHCEVNINDCASSPCANGLCVDDVGRYTCYCRPGFHGQRCELDYDECSTNPCENEAFCQDLQDNFTCHCHPGFTGRRCTTKVRVCVNHPCRNGAQCEEAAFTFKCKCPPGFEGPHCEVNTNDCATRPCLNSGTCVDRVAGYSCLCHEMHAGPNCQYPLDMFGPMIDVRRAESSEDEEFHVRNMYIVTAILTCAVLIVLGVLIACYCRVQASRPLTLLKRNAYRRHHDDASRPLDISSVASPRLSVDAIWEATSLNYDVTQLGSPRHLDSLKPRSV